MQSDIETIINKSEAVKKAKREKDDLTAKEKKELTAEEKEFKSKRKQIQEKLIKFATRIPVFMYLTDYREQCLKDVITQLEPGLFRRVTGLEVRDFELLVSLGVFNDAVMNDAVYKFRRYEDASLSYTGIERHAYDARVGLFDTSLTAEDYELMKQRDSRLGADGTIRVRGEKDAGSGASRRAAATKPAARPAVAAAPKTVPKRPTAPRKLEATRKPVQKPEVKPEAPETRPMPVTPTLRKPTATELAAFTIGDTVRHKAFGTGQIVRLDDARIFVYLGGRDRMFPFPGAFEQGFLGL